MALPDFARDRIGTVRWSGASGDALRARRAVERALATADWDAAGGGAIVCIRRLRGTLRGSVVAAGAARSWGERLRSLAAGAARPWREEVPSGAQAVVFADRVELFACLARDAARGGSGGCWWWPSLLGDLADAPMLLRQWRAAPELVPAALQRLAAAGEAATVLDCLGEQGAGALAQEVARAFGVDWQPAVAGPGEESAQDAGVAWPGVLREEGEHLLRDVRRALGGRAWAGTPARAELLAIALGLALRPRLVRVPGFAHALDGALRGDAPAGPADHTRGAAAAPLARLPQTGERDAGDNGVAVDATSAVAQAARAGTPAPRRESTPAASGERSVSAAPRATHSGTQAVAGEPAPARPTPARTLPPDTAPGSELAAGRALLAPAPGATTPAGVPAAPLPPAAHPFMQPRPPAALRACSAFAGTLYLLPVAVHLGWYGDFTQPLAPGLALHPADLLALLGERLAGAGWADDELPGLLAAWAGRAPQDPAGAGFVPAAGLPLGDWLAACEETLARRVAAALGVPAAGALQWLVRRPGLVALTDSTLAARFDLATHPLAIRLAGLDRDPGWVPAAGRRIEFHFDLGVAAP